MQRIRTLVWYAQTSSRTIVFLRLLLSALLWLARPRGLFGQQSSAGNFIRQPLARIYARQRMHIDAGDRRIGRPDVSRLKRDLALRRELHTLRRNHVVMVGAHRQ